MSLALVVDDSKTASAMLGKMLRKHEIDVAKVDSAEQALEYLQSQRPSMIFMDHMMPGMDGFDAVKAIKAEPELAEIPIIMHTSKSGDIYVGHARALGAADILSKPATEKALSEVLNRLRERAQWVEHAAPQVEVVSQAEVVSLEPEDEAPQEEVATAQTSPSFDVSALTEPASELNASGWRSFAAACVVAAILFAWLYFDAAGQRDKLLVTQAELLDVSAWALEQSSAYDYDELPLAGQRLRLVEQLVTRLVAMGFKGELVVRGHIGAFCLTDTPLAGGENLSLLAPNELPLSACSQIGMSNGQAALASKAQSEAFSRFISESPLLRRSSLRLRVEGKGSSEPRYAYPSEDEAVTAGDWNAVALMNNRIEFKIKPD